MSGNVVTHCAREKHCLNGIAIIENCKVRGGVSGGVRSDSCRVRDGKRVGAISYGCSVEKWSMWGCNNSQL